MTFSYQSVNNIQKNKFGNKKSRILLKNFYVFLNHKTYFKNSRYETRRVIQLAIPIAN